MRIARIWITALAAAVAAGEARAQPGPVCAPAAALATHDGASVRYALHPPREAARPRAVLIVFPGGSGFVDLDSAGCPRQLLGNSLVRSIPLFTGAGFAVALVDAPSNRQGEDGLADFRTAPRHAADIGRLVATLRQGPAVPVWLVGTSRGSISAVNAASRLVGTEAPDGLILTSAVMAGQAGARKPFAAQSVFDLPLERIRQPVLIVGHASDACVRSPPALMPRLAQKLSAASVQVVTVEGGPAGPVPGGLEACEGRSPHGFIGQEEEVAAGIARFVGTGRY